MSPSDKTSDTHYIRGELKAPRASGVALRLFVKILESRHGGIVRSKVFRGSGFRRLRKQAPHYANFEECEYALHDIGDGDVAFEDIVDEESVMELIGMLWKSMEKGGEGGGWGVGVEEYVKGYDAGVFDVGDVVEKVFEDMGEDVGGRLNAFVNLEKDVTRRDGRESDERRKNGKGRGVLEGVPISVKESLNVEGFSSSCGSCLRVGCCEKETADANVVEALKKAGCVVVGKTGMDEFGAGVQGFSKAFGQCHNPWNVDRVPGGSTGGGASSVAAGIVPLAIGTDGGGSVRLPAACCGLFGLKPTFGRLSVAGDPLEEEDHVDPVKHTGVLAANAADLALAYYVTAAFAPGNDLRRNFPSFRVPKLKIPRVIEPAVRGLMIGIYKPWNQHADRAIVKATKKAIEKMVQIGGATSTPIVLKHLEAVRVAHAIIILHEFLLLFRKCGASDPGTENYNKIGLDIRAKMSIARMLNDEDRALAKRIRSAAIAELEEIFTKVDVIVTPALGIAPPLGAKNRKTGESDATASSRLMRFMLLANFTGIPAVVFPVGFDTRSGTPIGMQAMAKPWNEEVLLKVAAFADKQLRPKQVPTRSLYNPLANIKNRNA